MQQLQHKIPSFKARQVLVYTFDQLVYTFDQLAHACLRPDCSASSSQAYRLGVSLEGRNVHG